VQILNLVIAEALVDRASDIYIDPQALISHVRFRIDTILHEKYTINKEVHQQIVEQIKKISQNGRFQLIINDTTHEIGVIIAPQAYGETVTISIRQ
jgi:type II secretory ATPase GspE/PulE/Tfp pilus assembly ATPase PilB-like protein